ncbi:RDD family protein [Brachybacterium atlanticum]|uniref:RDD family protein n=1 Tax=Brachybacterium atlanticum TaxID=2911888 RepID=UPI0021E08B51|nr:RDD family protein [Brachybacterium atlanticum]
MNQTRYCSTCGTLLSEGAAICGECGARYQASPYEKRATDAPGAWSAPPRPRTRAEQGQERSDQEDEGIELITADSLRPPQPGATALRSEEQYDRVMVTQPPMNQPGQSTGMPGGPGASASGPGAAPGTAPGAAPEGAPAAASFEPPLDGCAPATPVKRFLAALIDTVIATLVTVPFLIGVILIITSQSASTTSMILIGVGTALPAAYHLVMIWLVGAKGFTLGKLILGLRVTRLSEGGALGFVRALGRWAVYALFPLLMALSIFFDPRKLLRGFHDRAIDSVVADIKAGRNPLQPRPDDFERAGAEHYLGAPSVAVSTHENLLSEPGAAWRDQGASPVQPVDGAQGPEQGAPSPYAPGGSVASAAEAPASSWGSPSPAPQQPASDGGWAPPPVEPIPAAPAQSSWDQPSALGQSSWDQPSAPAQPSWEQPAGQDHAPSWGEPLAQDPQAQQRGAPAPEQPQSAPSWGQPSAPESSAPEPAQSATSWGEPSAPEQPQSWDQGGYAPAPQWGSPAPAPASGPVDSSPAAWGPPPVASADQAPAAHRGDAPSEVTGDAWGDDGVDEATRMSVPEDLGDLEATRISPAHLPPVKKVRLTTDDGAERVVEKAVVVGRNPSSPSGEVLFVMKDDTRSVSKIHLRIDGTGEELLVTDLGSTNGSTILREDGARENLVPETPTVLPAGARLALGDRTLSVERVQ